MIFCCVYSLLPGLDWIERENFLDVHLTRNRPPPARRRRSGSTQRTSFRRAGQKVSCVSDISYNFEALAEHLPIFFFFSSSPELPSPNPLPQVFQQHSAVGEWPEQLEFQPYSAEEESELGYMDDPYHEETYEDLLTPSFFSLERDALQIVEVMPIIIHTTLVYNTVADAMSGSDLSYKSITILLFICLHHLWSQAGEEHSQMVKCELCNTLTLQFNNHIKRRHPGCGQSAARKGYDSTGSYVDVWFKGECGSNFPFYLLCSSCREKYLAANLNDTNSKNERYHCF